MRLKILLAVIVSAVMACSVPLTSQRPAVYDGPHEACSVETEPPTPAPNPSLTGVASWYNARKNNAWYTRKTKGFEGTLDYAAAGQELRRMIEEMKPGHRYWRTTPVRAKITNPKTGISVMVYITDTCGCYSGTPKDRSDDKIIDLSPEVFQALGVPLGRGIQRVVVELIP
jgi:rare lipoprotein A (peptidoglycan hydrolase)